MKKILSYLFLLLTVLSLPACRSKKAAESEGLLSREEATWRNVTVPVRFELLEPQNVGLSGRLTMVRGEYVYVSLRMLGFEVAQIYVSPTEADVVVKQMNRMWIQEPMTERFATFDLPFSTLQEALLGRKDAVEKLPGGLDLTVGGTDKSPVLTLKVNARGKTLMGRMTLSLSDAQWDSARPAGFSAPGSDYKKIGLKDLEKAIK